MRIRTQFIISIILISFLLAVIALSIIITNQQLLNTSRQERIAENITQGASELSYLSNDYLIYRENQQLLRWKSKFESFSALVAGLASDRIGEKALIANIRENKNRMKEVFDSVISEPAPRSTDYWGEPELSFLQVSWSRMAIQSQGLVSDSTRLALIQRQEMDMLLKVRTLTLYVTLGMFGILILLSYMITFRRILRSINSMRKGTAAIGKGNLDFVIEEKKNDEIGDLSRAFNMMTANLKKIIATKSELEKEINERKLVEEELYKARDTAEKANQAKTQFIANMSHEFRTPLNAVLGYSQLLKKSENLTEKQSSNIDGIYNSGRHLLAMINDLLDLAKIEAGKMEIEKKSFQLPELLKKVCEIIGVQSEEKQLEFILEATTDLPMKIAGDEIRLQQILLNLLSNGVKFTEKGKLILRVGKISDENKIRFEVEDTGIGIPEKELEIIFDSFTQLYTKPSKTKGTGLGLTISRNLVRLMGSELYVKSETSKGSTFWFDINFEIINNEFAKIDFKNQYKKNDADSSNENIATPSDDVLKSLYLMAKIGDIMAIRKYIEKTENTEPELKPFISRLKIFAKNIDLNEIESYLNKYIKE